MLLCSHKPKIISGGQHHENQYTISYEKNGVYQVIGVNAQTAGQATAYFAQYKPAARIIGICEGMESKPGLPVITVPDDFREAQEVKRVPGRETKTVDKHGIKMVNLREISGETVNNNQGYSQISYDTATGELLETWHVGSSDCSWTVYHDPSIIHVCNTRRHMTMQQLADAVRDALAWEAKVKSGL